MKFKRIVLKLSGETLPKGNGIDFESVTNICKEITGLKKLGYDAISSSTMKQADIMTKGYYFKMLNLFLERYSIQLGTEKYDYRKIIKHLYYIIIYFFIL